MSRDGLRRSDPDFRSAITLGRGGYPTNTDSRAERAQMFSTLGHHGEINSNDRVVESFMLDYGLSLMNAPEIVFPPVAPGRRDRLQLRRAAPSATPVRRDGEGVLRLVREGRRPARTDGARPALDHYAAALAESQQHTAAEEVARLADGWRQRFAKVVPNK